MDREERRDLRDTLRCSNAAKIAFRQFWDRLRVVEIGEIDCTGTLKGLEKDLDNLVLERTKEIGQKEGRLPKMSEIDAKDQAQGSFRMQMEKL